MLEYFVDGRKIATYVGPTLFYYAVNGARVAGPGQAYLEEGFYRPQDPDAARLAQGPGTGVRPDGLLRRRRP